MNIVVRALVAVASTLALLGVGATSAGAATITVDTDSGSPLSDGDPADCTLAEAIEAANTDTANDGCGAGSGTDTIAFNITGAGPHIIEPLEILPSISAPVTIDGTTEPDYVSSPVVRIDGGSAGFGDGILTLLSTQDVDIVGLTVRNFDGYGINLRSSSSEVRASRVRLNGLSGINVTGDDALIDEVIASENGDHGIFIRDVNGKGNRATVTNSVVGLDDAGGPAPNGQNGITIEGNVDDTTIGTPGIFGTGANEGNVLSGNDLDASENTPSNGVLAVNTPLSPGEYQTGTRILGNLIGTDHLGTTARRNIFGFGVDGQVEDWEISDNVVSGNNFGGWIQASAGAPPRDGLMQGNWFGLALNGSSMPALGVNLFVTAADGLLIGGPDALSDDNVFVNAGSAAPGVLLFGDDDTDDVAMLGNRFDANAGLGINLVPPPSSGEGANEPTPNDFQDLDGDVNGLQNYPVLAGAAVDTTTGETTVAGTFNSTPGMSFRIEVFSTSNPDPSGHGEGLDQVGVFELTTDANGDAAFAEVLDAYEPAVGDSITATATGLGPSGEFLATSEFSANVEVQDVATGCDVPSPGDDFICGTVAGETIDGLGGDDVLLGLGGDDTLIGGPGKDLLIGGAGTDTGDYSAAAAGVQVSLQDGAAPDDGDGSSDILLGIENLEGSGHADVLDGDGADNEIHGNGKEDVISGFDGDDSLFGGNGGDTILGGTGSDLIEGANGDDTLKGNRGADTVKGGAKTDTIRGGDSNDTVKGGDGNDDSVRGQNGKDDVQGGGGTGDDCRGGPKDDTGGNGCETIKSIP